MLRQMTATTLLIEKQRTLLVWHRKFQKWQPPGGHIEPGELPHEAALREALEETGFEVEFSNLCLPPVEINRPNAISLPIPYIVMLQNVATNIHEPAHQHLDFCYVVHRKNPHATSTSELEVGDMRWFTKDDLNQLTPDLDIFYDTVQLLRPLLDKG